MRRQVRPGAITRRALALAKPVKLLILDVDGVLTDNGVLLGNGDVEYKRFGIQDGMGLKICQQAGIEVAVISGLDNPQARQRMNGLGIVEFHGARRDKLQVLETILSNKKLSPPEVAYMGDDWLDAPIMSRVGLPMAPFDAQPEILRLAAWISRRPGGFGAVREGVRFILMSQGTLTRARLRHFE